MSAQTTGRGPAARSGIGEGTVRALIFALAVYHAALGLYMVFAPGSFFEQVGPFGERNDHYIRDNATMNLAFAVGLFVAAKRSRWRVPVLAVVALQFGFHTINHIVDITEADPEWIGYFDAISLAVLLAFIAYLWSLERRTAEP